MNGTDNEFFDGIHPLIKQLYENVPEFDKIADHSQDDASYLVYGELSLYLFEEMVKNESPSQFTINCFNFFNLLGDKQDSEIDNLLIVGVYEGLYASKKCNTIARQLLKGRNKDVYEYWMINGIIRADY